MAQDFGDESGEMLLRALKRSALPVSKKLFEYFKNQSTKQNTPTPEVPQAPNQVPSVQASGYLYLPFGSTDNTWHFVQECSKNNIDVIGLTDKNNHGFILFESHNYENIEKITSSFIKENNINIDAFIHSLKSSIHGNEKEMMQNLSIIDPNGGPNGPISGVLVRDPEPIIKPELLDLSSDKETTGTYKLANSSSKTQWIANEVALAQKQATNLEEFRSMLAQKGIGIATSVQGENLFYEARRANDGSLLPYSHEQRDWSVSAETLKTKYGVDATNDWFNDKMPSTDGSMDSRGETADINQGIESHDGMDTNTSTLRVEREQTGTEVAPSVVRKNTEQATPRYSLSSEAKSMRQASKQLSKEHGIEDKVTDISDKLNPMR
ncbi:hypothetical protein AT54_01120 [Streptococcus equi subsp. zooepidemicus Sz12is]|uniref:hypothetical protein n=1 Tax=Streptococcus equi TaxID=1336 RepID=UPI0005B7D89F|nr:hypothetical protein [Streptococcus equi]KIS05212.1 hypothetical protein AT54_01120 [Streptococcus equi subsp. zooepidemicus Sz12is]